MASSAGPAPDLLLILGEVAGDAAERELGLTRFALQQEDEGFADGPLQLLLASQLAPRWLTSRSPQDPSAV